MSKDEYNEGHVRDGMGQASVTLGGELHVQQKDPLTNETWLRLITCPQCGASSGITLEARYQSSVAICPRPSGECGRAWSISHINAFQIRQMLHLATSGQAVALPDPRRVTVSLVPELIEDDLSLVGDPPHDRARNESPDTWSLIAGATFGQHDGPFAVSTGWARELVAWGMLVSGSLYDHLYPPAGGSVVDAHMTQLIVALAIYQASRRNDVPDLSHLHLEHLADELDTERASQLRALRPTSPRRKSGGLRRSDVHRLEHAAPREWDLWHRLAAEVVAVHCESRLRDSDTGDSSRPLAHRVKPWAGQLGSRRLSLARDGALDFTWYQGGNQGHAG
ncbi:hypothetical protein ACFVUW_10425 [Streptomyces xiamenensis]|uniref:hypothetical protein n=1 Tax=Streptomyces xiamenensis TaxID=408015 RepID=UPI0036ECA9CC